ncbi:MAG: hypothetical protein J6Y36_08625 [Treponema sp.]|nr:hypothetical protein [Treponema sp.]MBR5932772.1 hypothetical protein [Treponema sp.]
MINLLTFCLVLFAEISLFAEEKSYILGGEKGWPQFSVNESISYTKGRFGYKSVQLATNSRKQSDNTDLLLDFESKTVADKTNKYRTQKTDILVIFDNAVMGKGCGISRGRGNGLRLKGEPGTIFGTEGNVGSFAIEFWLKPSIAENGEIIFTWNSSRTINSYVMYQMICATFVNSHVEWDFKNIFDGYTGNKGEVVLKSYSTVVPDKWMHHVLTFNEETGLLEYKIDGHTEDLRYLTSTGHERGTIYQPVLGLPNDVFICPSYTGSIDDFRIVRYLAGDAGSPKTESIDSLSGEKYDTYNVTGGRFETQPVLTVPGAVIRRIETIESVPSQTEIRYYIRSGNNFFDWTDTYPEWKNIKPGEKIEEVSGKYFQLAAELYPDGDGKKSPSISEIKIVYYEPPLPLAPARVKAVPGDGYVDLFWDYSLDDTAAGYLVYYGNRPGEYLGVICTEGSSPIKVGNVNNIRLNGLKNGAIYYFAVATYSKLDGRIIGNFSDEVFARPGKAR